MSGTDDKRYGEIRLYYLIEDKKTGQEQTGTLYCHVCSVNAIGMGKSITFSIPLRDTGPGARMRIRYEFKWEYDEMIGDFESSNTIHTVAYYFSGLPDSVLAKPH